MNFLSILESPKIQYKIVLMTFHVKVFFLLNKKILSYLIHVFKRIKNDNVNKALVQLIFYRLVNKSSYKY